MQLLFLCSMIPFVEVIDKPEHREHRNTEQDFNFSKSFLIFICVALEEALEEDQ
jgi:hypothetical protein